MAKSTTRKVILRLRQVEELAVRQRLEVARARLDAQQATLAAALRGWQGVAERRRSARESPPRQTKRRAKDLQSKAIYMDDLRRQEEAASQVVTSARRAVAEAERALAEAQSALEAALRAREVAEKQARADSEKDARSRSRRAHLALEDRWRQHRR